MGRIPKWAIRQRQQPRVRQSGSVGRLWPHRKCSLPLIIPFRRRIKSQTPALPRPRTFEDITALSLSFLSGEITSYPFSTAPLSSESQLILPHLLRLASHSWWPVSSQPAVDGSPSEDDTVGWGPAGGYVYQKPFVEFFASTAVVERLERAIGKVKGAVDFLAGNNSVGWNCDPPHDHLFIIRKGEVKTSMQDTERNAVTWGVFPGQEIIQSTIIEEESFLTWKVRVPDHLSKVPSGAIKRPFRRTRRFQSGRTGRVSSRPTHRNDSYWNESSIRAG
jgi:hypothetical protein